MPNRITTHPSQNFRFRVSKLGALTHGGDFEIKPLTLFCGKNNSGKTWAMYATYGFFRTFWTARTRIMISSLSSRLMDLSFHNDIKKGQFPYKKDLRSMCNKIIAGVSRTVSRELPEILNADKSLLDGAEFGWIPDLNALINGIDQSKWEGKFRTPDGTITAKKAKGAEHIEFVFAGKIDMENRRLAYLIGSCFSSMVYDFIGRHDAFLMPAERSGLHLFYRELSSRRTALLHHASKMKIDLEELLDDVRRSPYATPIAHYIDWLNDLSDKKAKMPYADIAQLLATNLAEGNYHVTKEGDIGFMPHKKSKGEKDCKMGLHTTSSTIKSMFGLWYYLQHNAEAGDVVMIDEPELNLHPANQRILARLLVQMVNRGLYVVASTHSDYIVREINILLMLDKHPNRDALMKKHKIDGETISPKLVGAYNMSAQSGKIEPMQMDDEGMDAKTLDKVIDAQGDASDDIHFSNPK